MGLAAPKLKRMTMELGGSDPVIVAPDADLKAAARGIAIGRFWNCGQMCLGGKRIYVFDEVYDELLEQLTRTVSKYEPGLGWEKAEKPSIRIGPLLPIWRVSDLDEAINLANDSEYGLGASVWTNDVRIIHRVANEVEAGMKWVNQFHYGYDELPFGGVKQSGYGKEHGIEGLDYYLEDVPVVVGGLE